MTRWLGAALLAFSGMVQANLASAQERGWPQRSGGIKDDAAQAVAKDDNGNIYVAGRFQGAATFGPFTLNSVGASDIYVGKLDSSGNWQWAVRAGGGGEDAALAIAVDGSRNVYVTGKIQGVATFGSITISFYLGTEPGNDDIFVAKLDEFGAWRWAAGATGSGEAAGTSIAVNGASEVFITGYFSDYLMFGPGGMVSTTRWSHPTDKDVLVAKLTAGGAWAWRLTAQGVNDGGNTSGTLPDLLPTDTLTGDWCCNIIWGKSCNDVNAGFTNAQCLAAVQGFGGGTADEFAMFHLGRPVTLPPRTTNAYSDDRGTAIKTVDVTPPFQTTATTRIYVAGHFQGNLVAGLLPNPLLAPGADPKRQRDLFVGRIRDNGSSAAWEWVTDSATNSAGGRDTSLDSIMARAIDADALGNVYVTGTYTGAPQLGSLPPLPETISTNGFRVLSTDVGQSINCCTVPAVSTVANNTNAVVMDVDVRVAVAGQVGDLRLTLIAPNGARVLLASHRGGASNEGFADTVFDDDAAVSVVNGAAPFTGSFRPEERLSSLNGVDPIGTWRLEVLDDVSGGGGIGQIRAFQVHVNAASYLLSGGIAAIRAPLTSHVFVGKVADNGASAAWSWGTTAEPETFFGTFPKRIEATSIALDQRIGTDQGLYIAGNYSNPVAFVASDLATTAGSAVVDSASSSFITAGVKAGDTLYITSSGADLGNKLIASVDSETSLTLTAPLTLTNPGASFYLKSLGSMQPSTTHRDVMVAKLTASKGGWLWAKGGGSIFDDEANGLVADPSGTTFVAGRMQGVARFVEGSEPITYRDAVQGQYDVSERAYGVSLWFKTACSNCGLFSVVSGPAGTTSHDRNLYLSSGNLFANLAAPGNTQSIHTVGLNLNLADDQWHHVVHTFGPGAQQLWVDGILRRVGTETASANSTQTDITIGYSPAATTPFLSGLIQNVQLFDRMLTGSDVAAQFANKPIDHDEEGLQAAGPSVAPPGSGGDAFIASLNPQAPGQWRSFEKWVVGEVVPAPLGVPALQPDITIGEGDGQYAFLWNSFEKKLYSIEPVAAIIKWKVSTSLTDARRVLTFGASDWPSNPQIHVAGAPADLELPPAAQTTASCSAPSPGGTALTFGSIIHTTNGASVVGNKVFSALTPGYSVLHYSQGAAFDFTRFPTVMQVVRTIEWSDTRYLVDNVAATVGVKVDPLPSSCLHDDPTGKNGHIVFALAPFDGAGSDAAHSRSNRTGPIIPVNQTSANDMVVVWYARSASKTGMAWPSRPYRYNVQWPTSPERIVIASELGSEVYSQAAFDDAVYTNKRVYNQPDPLLPGLNPNEEHATFFPSNTGSGFQAAFALRADLPQTKSKPYALIKYQEASSGEWRFRVFEVSATDSNYAAFKYGGRAGNAVFAPYPVRLMGACSDTTGSGTPFWKDYKEQVWARSAGQITARYHYPLLAGFVYDVNGDGINDKGLGQCVPWLDRLSARTDCPSGGSTCIGTPIAVKYNICWPDESSRDFGAGSESCAGAPKVIGTDFGFLQVGETLVEPKNGAPDIMHQPSVEVIYDDENPNLAVPGAPAPTGPANPTRSLVQLIDPLSEVAITLNALPGDIKTESSGGRLRLTGGTGGSPVEPRKLTYSLRSRVFYDAVNKRLGLSGTFEKPATGEPILLLNVLSLADVRRLKDLSTDSAWPAAVDALYHRSRNPRDLKLRPNYDPIQPRPANPNQALLIGLQDAASASTGLPVAGGDGVPEPVRLYGVPGALTAGGATASNGWVTIAVGNDSRLSPGPVDLKVIKIVCGPYQGQVHVIKSDNVFDEQLTLRHSGDFGGDPDRLNFEWFTTPDTGGTPPPLPDNQLEYGNPAFDPSNLWSPISPVTPTPANGALEITIEGADIKTLSDNWFAVRYRGFPVCGNALPSNGGTVHSTWAGQPGAVGAPPAPQLGEGWIKRVTQGLNPFEARVKDFHKAATQTYASMIQQLGPRYEGDIALSAEPDAINKVGLIEAYETVLRRGVRLSIDGTPAVNYGPVNAALLNISTRIADFYALLGNEAYADAQDPTIGFGTQSGAYGTLAPTIFGFQNQVPSLLDEELTLLRGRDSTNASTTAKPVYNRLFWNFTNGDGEVAYSQIYGIHDVTGCVNASACGAAGGPDGIINESDAAKMYPQGHGDAWGHYLTAATTYYKLLRHPRFTWENRPEAVLVGGSPVQVDYLDERKFASVAAAKAKAGAEIVNLTYRSAYVEDPAGQWQGYKDTDTARGWGLAEWSKRAGQAAYFDWVTGNSLLPDVDPNSSHTGIQKIDRTTVSELNEIASQYTQIQTREDEADFGLNPLGLAKGVVPFDIDPSQVDSGKTHFEQIEERALKALDNAVKTFDNANQLSQMLRRNQDTLEDMSRNVDDQERDYKNRLIEIFGYPYGDDIGPSGIYPTGYDGPDLYHYAYVDASELTGEKAPPTQTVTARFNPVPGIGFFPGDTTSGTILSRDIPYTISSEFGLVKPQTFVQTRRAPGEIQRALADFYTERARFAQCIANYDEVLNQIQDKADEIEARDNLDAATVKIKNVRTGVVGSLSVAIAGAKAAKGFFDSKVQVLRDTANAAVSGLPTVTIVGTAIGGDTMVALRAGMKLAAAAGQTGFTTASAVTAATIATMTAAKAAAQAMFDSQIEALAKDFEAQQRLRELEVLVRKEPSARLECYVQQSVVEQSSGRYLTALAQGDRLLTELVAFRARTASDVQAYRYEDMAFRVFRNDALQKYRAQFDLAARYAFLAATAYDYETNLLATSSGAGRRFLTEIVKHRSLGQVIGGVPIPGSRGLADPLARMSQNFDVLKGQLGFNNPQTETNPFSLRHELFRQRDTSDASWQNTLGGYRVANLWDVPEFKRFARPFAPEDAGPQPGIVIPFATNVTFGLNFFGFPLGGGDSAYDPTNFATRIRSVGVWFKNYDTTGLSNTPRVYLVPAGADVLRSPAGNAFATREWRVADQVLPVPFQIGAADLDNPGYIPTNDNLSDSPGGIRRLSSFRAYHLGAGFDASQMSTDSRLIGRSVWNTRWLLIIPGGTLKADANEGLRLFINGVSDIQVFFRTYAYSGN